MRPVFQATVVDDEGNVIPEAEITVYNAGTSNLATIYSTAGGGALTNPFDADVEGFFQFYADSGRYDIEANGGITWEDVVLFSPTAPGAIGSDTPAAITGTTGTFTGAFTISTANGVDVNPGSDIDADLLTVGVTGSPRVYWDESEDAFAFTKGQRILGRTIFGSTTVQPDGTLHVHSGSAGTVTANSVANDLVVENSTAGGISVLTPDAQTGFYVFGSPTSNAGALLTFTYNTGLLNLDTNKVGAVINLRAGAQTPNLTLSGATPLTTAHGDVVPNTTEAQDLGSASKEWDNLFVQNAVTVSDERTKNIIGDMDDDQIDKFLTELNAIWFSKKDVEVVVTPAEPARTEKRQVTKKVKQEKVNIEVVDGVAVRKVEVVEVDQPVFEELPMVDESGKPVMELVSEAQEDKLDEEGKEIEPAKEAVYRQAVHLVPVMEEVEIPAKEEVRKTVSHGRPHSGFTAQQVKAAMDAAGIEDWAGYAYDEETDRHYLRPNEFIGILVKGYQVLKSKIG